LFFLGCTGCTRCTDRRDHDLVDRNTLEISELLTERVAFRRDPANDAVCRSQLLRQQIEMAIQGAQGGVLTRARHRGRGLLLLSLRSLQGPRAAAGVAAGHVDGRRFGSCRGTFW
jgi:hypothetical protein